MFLGQHGKMACGEGCEWVWAGRGAPVEGYEPTRGYSGVSCGGSRWRVSLGCCRRAPVLRSSVAMSPRRSLRLEGRQPMSDEEAAASLLALRRPGGAGPSLATEQSGAGDAIASETGCHVDATPAWDPPPMSDEEGDGAPGPSGHQAAAALSESDSEPQPGPGADAEDRQSDRDEGGHDWMHSGQTARWIPVARRAPPALRDLNLLGCDLERKDWDYLLASLIRVLLPKTTKDDSGVREAFTLERFKCTSRTDGCLLSHGKNRGGRVHGSLKVRPRRDDKKWAACSLTQQPDSRWLLRFSHIPAHVEEAYERSEALQSAHKTLCSYARPRAGRKIAVAALICWWAYGPPRPSNGDLATHFVCGQSRCLNPRHIGWATTDDNHRHLRRHKRTLKKSRPDSGTWRIPRRSNPPARRKEYRVDSSDD